MTKYGCKVLHISLQFRDWNSLCWTDPHRYFLPLTLYGQGGNLVFFLPYLMNFNG
jgi:hypothetical protein